MTYGLTNGIRLGDCIAEVTRVGIIKGFAGLDDGVEMRAKGG